MSHQTSSNDLANSGLIHLAADDSSNTKLKSQPSDRFVVLPRADQLAENSLSSEEMSVAELYVGQALMYFEQKQWSESITACQEALKAYPKMGVAYKIWGNSLQRAGKSAEAIGIYAKALQSKADMADIYSNLGSIYAKQRKWQQAIEHYQKSCIINPKNATPYRNLARVWDELQEYDKSADCFFKAISLQPNLLSAQNHFKLANNLLAEGNRKQAISCYKSCIDLEPNFLNAYARLADALEQDGQTEISLTYYQKLAKLQTETELTASQPKSSQQISALLNPTSAQTSETVRQQVQKPQAIALPESQRNHSLPQLQPAKSTIEDQLKQLLQAAVQQPNSASIQFELGQLYFESQQWQPAINCYLQAIKISPQEAKYYVHLGRAWSQVNNHDQANLAYYQGFSLKPEEVSGKNYFLLGEKLLKQNSRQKAIACYRQAISKQPNLIEAYWRLGEILIGIGNYQGAASSYRQAIKVQPSQAHSYLLLGKVFYQQQQWQPALACYQKAVELEPNNADLQHNLGEIFTRQQRWSDAAVAYRQAIALQPNYSWSHNNLGDALLKLEQWQTAAKAYCQAIKLKGDFVWSHYNLGEALAKLEQWDEALTAYQTAQQLEPNLPEPRQKIGEVLRQRTKSSRQEALNYSLEQIAQDPDNVELYHQAISLDKQNHQLYLGLGKALFKQDKLDEAITIYQVGIKLQPRNLELAMGLSEALMAKNPELSFQDVVAKIGGVDGTAALLAQVAVKKSPETRQSKILLELPCHDAPLVSIIIPVYNQIDYTLKCLCSIAEQVSSDLAFEVIVINDCSSDQTVNTLEQVRGLRLIDNSENLGFVHSCNRGINAAQGEYIYFLNNDTELRPQALEELLFVCQADSSVGAVGSKLIYPDHSLQEAGGIIWQDGSGWNYGRNENVYAPEYNYLRPVDYCSGASLLVRKSALLALEGFDAGFAPAYYEDTDLCFALRHQLGLKVMYQPKSVVVHHEGVSCGVELSNGIKRYQSINREKFTTKWAKELQDYLLHQGSLSVAAASRKHSGKKTILVIDLYAPCYDKESGARRLWQLLKIFKKLDYHVILAADNGAKEQPYIDKLQNLQIEVLYTQEGYGNSILQQVEARLPLVDIAWVCRPELYEKYAELIRQHSQIKLVYDTIDLHYLRIKRGWELSPQSHTIENMRQWVRMQARELKAAHEADLTVTITPVEQKILQQQQVKNLAVIPNLHLPYRGEKPAFAQREGLLFIGSYNHPPNIDAVQWLCQEIMPLVWSQLPDLQVTLLGNQPTEEVKALANDQVTVTDYVANVTPYFLSHRVFVAPLRYGAGMKGKIGQSLEYGLPIVSTAIGVEGMDLLGFEEDSETNSQSADKNVLIAQDTEEFAKQIIRLYGDETLWNQLTSNSEKAIAPYAPEVIKEGLSQVLNNLFSSV
jgi:O-antigen biosynthesis protein